MKTKRVAPFIYCLLSLLWLRDAGACDRNKADSGNLNALIICSQESFEKSDAELNRIYLKITASLKPMPGELEKLRGFQRTWIKEKEARCKVYFNRRESGVEGPIDGYACYTESTNDRINELGRQFPLIH